MSNRNIENIFLELPKEKQEKWFEMYAKISNEKPICRGRPTNDFCFFILNKELFMKK